MENQHREIKGYRELNSKEIETMNEIKAKGPELEALLDKICEGTCDPRWVAIAKTHLQQGLMAATRAVAQPDFF